MTKANASLKTNELKWGKPLMQAGWTAIPNVIIACQKALKLQAMDMNILLHLASFWWEADNKPHPAKQTIAKTMGIHASTVQRRIRAMEKRGLIRREYRRSPERGNLSNKYDFAGLIAKATDLAKAELKKREKVKREKAATLRRGGAPALPAVATSDDAL